jgi:hypothetical protein
MSFDRAHLPDPNTYFESQGLVLRGPRTAKWKTTACNFHDGSDSMRINTTTGAWVCMACGAKGGDVLAYEMAITGREFVVAAKALGCWVDDGKPLANTRPAPLPPRAALQVIGFEATLIAVAGGNLSRGLALSTVDLSRVMTAAGRIHRIVEAYQ